MALLHTDLQVKNVFVRTSFIVVQPREQSPVVQSSVQTHGNRGFGQNIGSWIYGLVLKEQLGSQLGAGTGYWGIRLGTVTVEQAPRDQVQES